jgi:hypothetical protein
MWHAGLDGDRVKDPIGYVVRIVHFLGFGRKSGLARRCNEAR